MNIRPNNADIASNNKPMDSDQSLHGGLTAQPKDQPDVDQTTDDSVPADSALDAGEMNLEDAKESGYTDEDGHAISMAKPDVEGSPTGAFTDIGAGRSSAVVPKRTASTRLNKNSNSEQAH